MNLNKILLGGRLTRDPDPLRYTPNGTAIAEISIAINRVTKNHDGSKSESVTYVDITCFGRTAEIVSEFLQRGSPIFIEGRLQLVTWDDKQTGQKRSKLRVVAENMQMLGSRPPSEQKPAPVRPVAPPKAVPPKPIATVPVNDEPGDDIPF
jgi:single-strand DNA-binding protein